MKNINKNAIRALASYNDSYLVHNNFSDFSLDGSVPFTIEVSFVYQDSNHGSFYCQEDGMDLGIKGACPYFTHPALGNLSAPNSFTLEKSYWHFIAVVYDGSTLKMYIHGFEIASITVSKKADANTKNFYIGKGFHGYIGCIRVLSKALNADEIMRDQGEQFPENTACELWTDFSGVAYKDISRNAMGLWRTGNDAHCANVVNCTVLDRNGLYLRDNPIDYRDGFSLTGKIYPDFGKKGNFYIYCLRGDTGPYLQLYLTEAEDGYYLALDLNGTNLISERRVEGLRWTDYAVTADINKGTVCLYLDGVKCGEQTYTGLKAFERAKAIIGGKYYASSVGYNESFAGLLDYCAEFNCVLTDEVVDSYAEDQPYLYAEGLTALLLFGWGEPEDIYEDRPLAEYGGGYYSVMADTNHISAPIGLNWYVPDDDEEYWNSLSAYEQWEITLFYTVINEVIEGLTGIPMKAEYNMNLQNGMLQQRRAGYDTGLVNRRKPTGNYERLRNRPREYSPAPEQVQNMVEGMTLSIGPATYAVASQTAEVHCISALWAGIRVFFANHWKEILAVAAVVIGVIAAVVAIIKKSRKERPKNESAQLEVKSVSWNHGGDPKNGSIHFHDSVTNLNSPVSMVYTPGDTSVNITGVFVPSMLQEIRMDIEIANKGTENYEGYIELRNPYDEKNPDNRTIAKSMIINVAAGNSVKVELEINQAYISQYGYHQKSDYYDIICTKDNEDIFLIRCEYVYYTLFREPISPWNNKRGEYNPFSSGYVCTPLLKVCMEKFPIDEDGGFQTDDEQLIHALIVGMNNCKKLTYDVVYGAPYFCTIKLGFKYIKFVNAMESEGVSYLNCADCATIVSSLCAMHGMDYPMTILSLPYGRSTQATFRCNQIQAITAEEPVWKYPFERGEREKYGGFSFHMVNRSNEPGISGNTKIYDACLKVDGGSYPGHAYPYNQAKSAQQPIGMCAYGSESAFVNVPLQTAYTADIYRERLVYNGAEACFCCAAYRVLEIDQEVTQGFVRKSMTAAQDSFDIKEVLENNSHITGWGLLDDMYGETEWTFMYDDKRMEICRYMIDEEDMGKAVGRVMARFSNPDSVDISGSYPGSCCFTISDSCYVIWKKGDVYRILGQNAKEVADCIYNA